MKSMKSILISVGLGMILGISPLSNSKLVKIIIATTGG